MVDEDFVVRVAGYENLTIGACYNSTIGRFIPLNIFTGSYSTWHEDCTICASSGDTTGRPLHFLDLNNIDQRIQDFCFTLS